MTRVTSSWDKATSICINLINTLFVSNVFDKLHESLFPDTLKISAEQDDKLFEDLSTDDCICNICLSNAALY